MTINETLEKADAALAIILKHDEEDSDCTFKQLLEEIIEAWRDN
jgi:hypothetical protein